MSKLEETVATGRRKTSVASARLRAGKGSIVVNHRAFDNYFPQEIDRLTVVSPLKICETAADYDLVITVKGGGLKGQAEAIRLAIARALVEISEERRKALKEAGFLTRDARMKERKKYGLAGARKRYQFSKR